MKLGTFICVSALALTTTASADTIRLNALSAKQIANLQYMQNRFGPGHFLVDVAFCESSLEHTDDNGNVTQGDVDPDDTGLMQINKGYHLSDARRLGYDLNQRSENVDFAEHLYRTQGEQPWSASDDCLSDLVLPVL